MITLDGDDVVDDVVVDEVPPSEIRIADAVEIKSSKLNLLDGNWNDGSLYDEINDDDDVFVDVTEADAVGSDGLVYDGYVLSLFKFSIFSEAVDDCDDDFRIDDVPMFEVAPCC